MGIVKEGNPLRVLTMLFLQLGCLPFQEYRGGVQQNCLHAKWRLVGYCKRERDRERDELGARKMEVNKCVFDSTRAEPGTAAVA